VFPHLSHTPSQASHTASHATAQPKQASGATRALADDEQLLEWVRWLEEDGNWEAKQDVWLSVSKKGQNGGRFVRATRRDGAIVIEVQRERLSPSYSQIIDGKNRPNIHNLNAHCKSKAQESNLVMPDGSRPRKRQKIEGKKGLAAFFDRKEETTSSASSEHAMPPAEETTSAALQESPGEEIVATEECHGFSGEEIGFPTSDLRDFPTELNLAMETSWTWTVAWNEVTVKSLLCSGQRFAEDPACVECMRLSKAKWVENATKRAAETLLDPSTPFHCYTPRQRQLRTSTIRAERDRGRLYKLDLARARQKLSIFMDDFGRLVQAMAAEDIPHIRALWVRAETEFIFQEAALPPHGSDRGKIGRKHEGFAHMMKRPLKLQICVSKLEDQDCLLLYKRHAQFPRSVAFGRCTSPNKKSLQELGRWTT